MGSLSRRRDAGPKVSRGYNVAKLSDVKTAGKYGDILDTAEEEFGKESTDKIEEVAQKC